MDTLIGHLRIQVDDPGTGLDRGAIQNRLSFMLGAADLRPSGLPPSAILVVRRLPDPLPGGLSPWQPAALLDASWERAARQALADILRLAPRPSDGVVPWNATAVLFGDMSELLACLALELSLGNSSAAWWWEHIKPDPAPDRHVYRLLYRQAPLVPAVFSFLYRWGRAADVIKALTPDQALATLQAVRAAYRAPDASAAPISAGAGLPQPWAAAAVEGAASLWSAPPSSGGIPGEPARGGGFAPWAPLPAPWESYLPQNAVPAGLTWERASLLGAALCLHRAPALGSSPSFWLALRRWQAVQRQPALPLDQTEADKLHRGAPRRAGRPYTAPIRGVHQDGPPGGQAALRPQRARPSRAFPPVPQAAPSRSASPAGAGQLNTEIANSPQVDQYEAYTQTGEHSTGLGGVFYLVNLFSSLDLPDCFEPGWRLASQLGAWGALEVVGRALLDAFPGAQDDPLWRVIAGLAGRDPHDPPGSGVMDCERYLLPQAWPFQNQAGIYWTERLGQLQVWASSGFMLADLPLQPGQSSPAALGALRERYQLAGLPQPAPTGLAPPRQASFTHPWFAALTPPLRRWIELVLPYLHYRLQAAMPSTSGESLAETLLVRPARLYASNTHIDLVMSLESICLPARLAGLDRNPGWQPAFGRVIQFHFE